MTAELIELSKANYEMSSSELNVPREMMEGVEVFFPTLKIFQILTTEHGRTRAFLSTLCTPLKSPFFEKILIQF